MNNLPSPYQFQHSDFTKEIAIVCPKCAGKAQVKGPGLYQRVEDTLIACICTHCGYNQKYKDKKADVNVTNSKGKTSGYYVKLLGGEVDPFFHHPLWYTAPCLEGSIWAYNVEHLGIIETFVASTNRSRNGLPYKNKSIASRMPKWISASKNRAAVLKCIRVLKEK